jgi:hypothetical protein
MNNDPAQIAAILRSLIVYAVCAVLAIVLGILMTNPMTYSSLGFVAILCTVPIIPILLRWHHPLMVLCWNAPIVMFFIKGAPNIALVMITMSLAISVTERALNQPRFIKVPQITAPLLAMILVILVTAKLTGGIGLKAFGSDVYGGKKYIFLIVGILGYFALTARPLPPEKARRYVTFLFIGGTLAFIQDFYWVAPGILHPIYWIIPPLSTGDIEVGTTRLVGTGWAAVAFINVLIARYGLRGIFMTDKLWRPVVFFISFVLIFFGGFRSALAATLALIMLQFFLEGLHRTKLLPFFVVFAIGAAVAIFPLGAKLPFTFQRTLAFLPDSVIQLSPEARLAAQGSTEWRLEMWQALLPQIPKYLLLGKGYTITSEDFASMGADTAIQSPDAANQGLAISGDYHSGPLSVIIPFGIWGAITFLWFIGVSLHVMYRNFRYGPPALQSVNTFLFSSYVMAVFCFFFTAGAFSSGMLGFCGTLGLSVCLNHGVCRAPVRAAKNISFKTRFAGVRARPQPAFQNRGTDPRPL